MIDALTRSFAHSHGCLRRTIDDASLVAFPRLARDGQTRADRCLITATRHLSATSALLVPTTRDALGKEHAQELARVCKSAELALFRAKARLYGASQAMGIPWSRTWDTLVEELGALMDLEEKLVAELVAALARPDCDRLAARLQISERRAPTRPHPYLPHRGLAGRLTRAVTARLDAVWDEFEGRVRPPDPVPPPTDSSGLSA